MPQSKEHNTKPKLDKKAIEKGFIKVAEDIAMLKDVLAQGLDEINRLKGFQYVVAQVLDECEICSKEELYELAAKKYSSKLANDLKKFLNLNLPALSEKFSDVKIQGVSKLESVFEQFAEEFFDEEGKPKAKA
tara:strand:+ start:43 stop:441 length:399 start_codon:yes stop_codon:yes gene_type:complete